MFTKLSKKILAILMSAVLIFAAVPFGMIASAATTVTVLDGKVTITDTATNMSESNGVVTVKAKGGLLSQTTNTITITNETANKSKLTFTYSASNYSSFSESSASGPYEATLDSGETVTLSIKGKRAVSNNTATLTLSNFSLVPAADSSNVTFDYDSAYGSITVDGTAVADGGVKEIPLSGAALAATTSNGGKFYGWVDAADGKILSTETSYTVTPAEDMTIKAVFIGANSTPHFMLGKITSKSASHGFLGLTKVNYYAISSATHIFDNLKDAASASAASATSKGIVLMNDGTLEAGTYTIPAGSTLLIPFDDANSTYKTEADGREFNDDIDGNGTEETNDPTKTERYTHGYTVYRNLTMATGANIILNGELSVPAKHLWAQGGTYGGGSPVDGVGQITMAEGSSITVNNGGGLYAYGFITGNGTVTAKNGAKVYEYFQLTDFRGGTQSTDMQNGVFPISQYYVQNIEVPLTLEYGAREYSYTTLYMSSTPTASSVAFIGPNDAMFNLESGKVTKRYDGKTDRLVVEVDGKMTVSPISMKISSTNSIDSKKYELPINSNISLTVKRGSEIIMGQDIALLPGSEILVEESAVCTVGSGVNIYIYDADQWGNYAGAANKPLIPVINAPSREYIRTTANLIDATIQVEGIVDASQGYVYTTAGGANIFSNGNGVAKTQKGTETITYQLVQGSGYVSIPITPAKLKNADGTYLASATDTYTYQTDGKWHCEKHNYTEVVTAPTCTESGSITHTCSVCEDRYTEKGKDALGHSYGDWIVDVEPKHSDAGNRYKICLICGGGREDEKIPAIICDYDADGNVNGTELTKMRKFLLGTDTPENDGIKKLFDMNDNGELSIVDLVKLKKYIADIN